MSCSSDVTPWHVGTGWCTVCLLVVGDFVLSVALFGPRVVIVYGLTAHKVVLTLGSNLAGFSQMQVLCLCD